jgi:H/ACA ribonucleoprotein complex subunit 2
MAKEIEEKKLKKEKKDKKEKKEKRAETDGVSKPKKEKKEKKSKDVTDALEAAIEEPEVSMMDVDSGAGAEGDEPSGALVPFAFPLADNDKEVKKILKTVKKSAKTKTLRRGVKEVVKALRKSQGSGNTADINDPSAIVIIAADISPMDVISHIPVLCEDHGIPYIYIKSRAQLGEASATKRPTSVVMVAKAGSSKKAKDVKEDDAKEFDEAYGELQKLVAKAAKTVRK